MPSTRAGPRAGACQPTQSSTAVGTVGSRANAPGQSMSCGSQSATATSAARAAQPRAAEPLAAVVGRTRPASATASRAPMPSSHTRVVVVKKAGRGEVCENHTDHTNDDATSAPRAPATTRRLGRRTTSASTMSSSGQMT